MSATAPSSLSRMLHDRLLADDAAANREIAQQLAEGLFRSPEATVQAEGNWGDVFRDEPAHAAAEGRCGFGWHR